MVIWTSRAIHIINQFFKDIFSLAAKTKFIKVAVSSARWSGTEATLEISNQLRLPMIRRAVSWWASCTLMTGTWPGRPYGVLTSRLSKYVCVIRDHGIIASVLLDQVTLLYMNRLLTKPTKWHVRIAKTQISLCICPVWSESLLSAWRKLGSLATHWAQAKTLVRLGALSFCWFCHEAAHLFRWPTFLKMISWNRTPAAPESNCFLPW